MVLLIALAVVLVGISLKFINTKGDIYTIKSNGEIVFEGELPKDEQVIEKTVEFNGYNRLLIKSEGIYVTEADCPDKVCIRLSDEQTYPIVCLPHKLVVDRK